MEYTYYDYSETIRTDIPMSSFGIKCLVAFKRKSRLAHGGYTLSDYEYSVSLYPEDSNLSPRGSFFFLADSQKEMAETLKRAGASKSQINYVIAKCSNAKKRKWFGYPEDKMAKIPKGYVK